MMIFKKKKDELFESFKFIKVRTYMHKIKKYSF